MGGAEAVKSGRLFEEATDLKKRIHDEDITILHQREIYKHFGYPFSVSKLLIPDEVVINDRNNTVYIIEKKFQTSEGSNDEKLWGCEFRKFYFSKVLAGTGYNIEVVYLFNDWFKKEKYKDTFEYMDSKGVKHFFNEIPLNALGINE